jgi:hypothetical protein
VRRATDPAFFNECISRLIFAPYAVESARWAKSVVLEFEDGCIAFEQVSPGVYSAHWCFLPKAKDVVTKGKQALGYLFAHGAQSVVGKTPHDKPHAKRASRAVGMQHLFDCPRFAHTALTREQWQLTKEG